jgi:hypothetical protein
VLQEVAVESGNYPPGDGVWAWSLAGVFSFGALVLFRAERRWDFAALVFDTAVVSLFVVLYGFELGTPVRELLVLPVLEAGFRYGLRGGLAWPLTTAPALALFEWRQADRLDYYPFDVGHILGPIGIELLAGVLTGSLRDRVDRA